MAKYNVDDSFDFEKGRESLDIDGSEISFSDLETKEGGEVLGFAWDSGVYDIHTVSVKAGPNVYQKAVDGATSGSFTVSEFDDERPYQAISNVVFCIKVYWQVDFGNGDVPIPPDYDARPNPPDLILAAVGGDGDIEIRNPSAGPKNVPSSVDTNEMFDIDEDADTATIEFNVSGDSGPDLHIVSFETPGPYQNTSSELGDQVLFDRIEMDGLSEGTYTWTVDLPTL